MSRADMHFRLRIPPEIKQWVSDEAQRNRRSMTAEIIVLLERAKAATGGEFGDLTPAADQNRSALPGAQATHG